MKYMMDVWIFLIVCGCLGHAGFNPVMRKVVMELSVEQTTCLPGPLSSTCDRFFQPEVFVAYPRYGWSGVLTPAWLESVIGQGRFLITIPS